MRQTAGRGGRVSAHTQPSPVATEKGDPGRRIRATSPSSGRGFAGVPIERGGSDDLLVGAGEFDDALVEQPDVVTAMPSATTTESFTEMALLLSTGVLGSGGPLANLSAPRSSCAAEIRGGERCLLPRVLPLATEASM